MFLHDRARNPDTDAGSAVSSRFLCNQIVLQEGLDALSNDELYKLLNYRESRLKLSKCLERAEKLSAVKDIPGKQNALAPEENNEDYERIYRAFYTFRKSELLRT